jgi:dTDP-4-dehydrorhamnose reductase
MNVLVTGASGLVGRRLVGVLSARGHRVSGLDRQGSAPGLDLASFHAVDLTDAAAVTRLLRELQPAVVVNCAAMTDVDGCERSPAAAWAVNAAAVATLAQFVRETDAHLVHVSTDYVFDGDSGPYEVDAIPNPRGAYAVSKMAGECAVRAIAPTAGWTIARPAVVYGWPAVAGKNNFGSWLVEALGAGKPVKLFSDQWVSPSLAGNVAEMLAELAERRLGGVFHTAGSEVVDRVTFGHRLCERFGFDKALVQPSRMADVNLPSPRPAKSGLVVTKTSATLNTQPLGIAASLDRLSAEVKGAA